MSAEKTELRGLAPTELVAALDAVALSYNTDRTTLVNRLLTQAVNRIAHRAKILQSMARGNALLSEPVAPVTDFGELS